MENTNVNELISYLDSREKYLILSQRNYIKTLKKYLSKNGEISPLHYSLLMKLKEYASQ